MSQFAPKQQMMPGSDPRGQGRPGSRTGGGRSSRAGSRAGSRGGQRPGSRPRSRVSDGRGGQGPSMMPMGGGPQMKPDN